MAASGQLEAKLAGNIRQIAIARVAAEGVLQETVFHLIDRSPNRWQVGEGPHHLPVAGGEATIEVQSEAARVGLNATSPALLSALLARLGVARHEAAALTDAMLDWRTANQTRRPLGAKASEYHMAGSAFAPPEADFETFDELALVRGMTPELLAKLSPYLSVYQTGSPDRVSAAPLVRLALQDAGELSTGVVSVPDANAPPVLDVLISVMLTDGTRTVHHSIVRLAPDAAKRPFQLLDDY